VTLLRSAGNAALTSTLESVNARIQPVRRYDYVYRAQHRLAALTAQTRAVFV